MRRTITIKILPADADNDVQLRQLAADNLGIDQDAITGMYYVKRSIDARGRQVWVNGTLEVFINEPYFDRGIKQIDFPDVSHSPHTVIIVGCGPAGLFAALSLIETGIRPIIVERGRNIRARRRDLAALNKEGIVQPDSNYCFGEGGAGTYSDGKLYTRSNKRGDIKRILNLFVQFGADPRILYDAHPHIGTNKLPQIITNISKQITDSGGQIFFEQRVNDFIIEGNTIRGVSTLQGVEIRGDATILATGHSARDIFELLHRKQIEISFKPFALGVRVEHPQALIDQVQYHMANRGDYLPPASYSLVQQVENRGVFSFCMCPGGIIAPAATSPGELVVNGWSPSKRNNPFANSGMVVSVEAKDVQHLFETYGPLAGLLFQQEVETKAFAMGGGNLVAPAQRLTDYVNNKVSGQLPDCSYLPGIRSASIKDILPPFIANSLRQAFVAFGKKMPGYLTNEALVVATESRTSSPVRIPRNPDDLQHPQIHGLYPCSEGAGYAGGIVSAAMDGENVSRAIALRLTTAR